MRVIGTATAAIAQQTKRLEASAKRLNQLAKNPEENKNPPDIAKEAAVRIDAGAITEANLAVIKSEDERLKSVLDILA